MEKLSLDLKTNTSLVQYFPDIILLGPQDYKVLSNGKVVSWIDRGIRLYEPLKKKNTFCLGVLKSRKASYPDYLDIWEPENINMFYDYEGFRVPRSFCVLPNDQVAIGFNTGEIKVYDNKTNLLYTIEAHILWIKELIILPNGKLLSIGEGEEDVKIWNEQECIGLLKHSSCVNRIKLFGGKIITGCYDGIIKEWSCKNYKILSILEGHTGKITALDVVQDYIISGSSNGEIFIWNKGVIQTRLQLDCSIKYIKILLGGDFLICGKELEIRNLNNVEGNRLILGVEANIGNAFILSNGKIALQLTGDSLAMINI